MAKIGKMVKRFIRRGLWVVGILKPKTPKADSDGTVVKLTGTAKRLNWRNGKTGRAQANGKMLKPTGPNVDSNGENGRTSRRDEMVK